ncbi:IclR family transcriptional regulator [Rhizobium wenxiniae]|uniref:IclR family transcriptional regulator n=1 Tax=Rhizobium wenxiniae TaxID=1737357 RepID=UPI001C6E378A|nr:IclR family transcriptional regulator [Rhizobium wenxiniae]MBW9088142.1 IclR family transcriptional regulator [Rhizobium wenxiniae]
MKESERYVTAVLAALKILDAFEGTAPLRFSDLMNRTGLGRSRILRYVGTLEAAGYLVINPGPGTFELGPKAYRLGLTMKQQYEGMVSLLRPRLEELSVNADATAFFSVVRGRQRLVIAKSEPRHGVRYAVDEGQIRPLHVGATGRVLLAFGSTENLDAVLNQETLEALTDKTLTDADRIRAAIMEIRGSGFASSVGEATGEALAMAVPVLDSNRRMVGALTLAGPIGHLQSRADLCEELLKRESEYLSPRITAAGD